MQTIDQNPARPRPERPSPARQRILDAADRLFYNEGIHAVGIHRIVDEAAVTRVTLYRHFPAKDDLISAYLERRAQSDHDQINAVIAVHEGDPRGALTELATALTHDDFASISRGCPFINASAEYATGDPVRRHGAQIRAWVTGRIEELLLAAGHRTPVATAQQLMMVRTGAVVSRSLDDNHELQAHFLECWNQLIDHGLPDQA